MPFIPIQDSNPWRRIRAPWVSWGIILANIIVYALQKSGAFGDPDWAYIAYGLIPASISGAADGGTLDFVALPAGLTLLSSTFFHADIWHLLGNMVFLWVFADNVEDAMGHLRFAAFYILCAFGSGLAMVVTEPSSLVPTIGASGAVSGVVAAYFLLHPRVRVWALLFARIPMRLNAFWVLGSWIAYQFVAAFVLAEDGDGIAWFAHVGGVIVGAVLVLFLRRPGVPLFDKNQKTATLVVPAGRVDEKTTRPPPRVADDPARSGPWG